MLKKSTTVTLIPLLMLGAVGYLISLVAHTIALAKVAPIHPGLVIGLFAGMFATFIPAAIRGNAVVHSQGLVGFGRKKNRQRQEAIFRYSPAWLRWLVGLSGAYAFINFVLSGVLIETSGYQDSYLHSENFLAIRMMTGHLMAFYAYSFSVLYSWAAEAMLDEQST